MNLIDDRMVVLLCDEGGCHGGSFRNTVDAVVDLHNQAEELGGSVHFRPQGTLGVGPCSHYPAIRRVAEQPQTVAVELPREAVEYVEQHGLPIDSSTVAIHARAQIVAAVKRALEAEQPAECSCGPCGHGASRVDCERFHPEGAYNGTVHKACPRHGRTQA